MCLLYKRHGLTAANLIPGSHRRHKARAPTESRATQTVSPAISRFPVASGRSFPVPWGVRPSSSTETQTWSDMKRSSISICGPPHLLFMDIFQFLIHRPHHEI